MTSFVEFSLNSIRNLNLHGIDRRPPTGFLRGIDVLSDDFENALRRSCVVYRRNHGVMPNLLAPSSFTEKQLLFKFFAPIPLVATSDKLGSRSYAANLPESVLSMPKVIWSSASPELPSNEMIKPGRYWLKSSHSSGTNMPVTFPLGDADRQAALDKVNAWMRHIHNKRLALWWYEFFERRIYLEEDLSDDGGFSADDWKFFVCNGKVVLFQHDKDRHTNHVQTIYSRDGIQINKELYFEGGPAYPLSESHLIKMLQIAESIGKSFDFIRVDLFIKDNSVYLGELGLVPNGCSIPIRSPEIDHFLGSQWKAPWIGSLEENAYDFYASTLARQLFDEKLSSRITPENLTVPWVS